MARKRNPILGKAWDLIVSPMAKVRNPITRKLLLFKKAKKFKLLRHYNHAFAGEYLFSPSSTPLFRNRRFDGLRKRSRILALLCGGNGAESVVEEGFRDELDLMLSGHDGVEKDWSEPLEYGVMDAEDAHKVEEEENGSVDQRAEMFIQRFYEEMRNQMQDKLLTVCS